MGIDYFFVDELYNFKNLMFNICYVRVFGMGNFEGSMKVMNMFFVICIIQECMGRDLGVIFLFGMIIFNSLIEFYFFFKYFCLKEMEWQGIICFDGWVVVYVKKSMDFEFLVINQVVQKECFCYFIKVLEFVNFYVEIIDYKIVEDVGVDRLEFNE